MERMNVNPTRMMLTQLKRRHKTAVRGHKLLKDKRDELMKEFLEQARENGRLRQEVERKLEDVYDNFTRASAVMSQEVMEESLMLPKQGVNLEVKTKNIMSVDVPDFSFTTTASDESDIYPYGFIRTTGELDNAISYLSEIFPLMLQLAASALTVNRTFSLCSSFTGFFQLQQTAVGIIFPHGGNDDLTGIA